MFTYVFIDDHCLLCNKIAQSLIRLDGKQQLKFGSVQQFKQYHPLANQIVNTDSIIVLKDQKIYAEAKAIDIILQTLKRHGFIRMCMKVLPLSFQNKLYQWLARNRHRLGKRADSCFLLSRYTNRLLKDEEVMYL